MQIEHVRTHVTLPSLPRAVSSISRGPGSAGRAALQIAGEPGGDVYRLGFLREVHLEVAVSLLSAKVGLYAFLFTPMDVSAARKSGSMTMFGSRTDFPSARIAALVLQMRGRRRCGEVRDGARDLSPRIAATAGLVLPHFHPCGLAGHVRAHCACETPHF